MAVKKLFGKNEKKEKKEKKKEKSNIELLIEAVEVELKSGKPGTEEYDILLTELETLKKLGKDDSDVEKAKKEKVMAIVQVIGTIGGLAATFLIPMLSMASYNAWFHEGLEFEREGTYLAKGGVGNLLRMFNPFKK